MTDATLLRVDDLRVHYRARDRSGQPIRALDGVSLDWRRDELLGVVGESGSGKSTLARAIVGLCRESQGTIALEGQPVAGRRELRLLRRRVQLVHQDPYDALNPRETIRAIVSEPLQVHRVPRTERERRVCAALDAVELPARLLDRLPHELSGGQRQRVAIAAALVIEPDGLICDEPVSMLDVSVRAQILRLLCDLQRDRGLALMFITHDLGVTWALCDRVAVMYLGRIVEQGPAVDVIGSPQHPYTRALVDVAPSVRARRRGAGALLPGEPPDPRQLPAGCRFHPRCPNRVPACQHEEPALRPAPAAGHAAACIHLPYQT